jgi:hypothetical protein
LLELIHPADWELVTRAMAEALRGGAKPKNSPKRLVR